jgi:hypothetical protein
LEAVELVAPGSPAELAEAIERSMQPWIREAATRQAEAVRERFRWPADEVLRFYLSLL